VSLSARLTPPQRDALLAGLGRLSLSARIVVLEPRTLASLPLGPGNATATNGHRLRILSVEEAEAGPALDVQTSRVLPPGYRWPEPSAPSARFSGPEWALVNRSRGEARRLSQRSSSGNSLGLVLPGAPTLRSRTRLESESWWSDHDPAPLPSAWLAGAELVAVEWVEVATFPQSMVQSGPAASMLRVRTGPG
jgi:hypothetical protein